MAKYDRDFLVPYIQNVCALEITRKKIDSVISSLNYTIYKNQEKMKPNEPVKMKYESESLTNGILRLGGGILLVCGALLLFMNLFIPKGQNPFLGFSWFVTIVGGAFFFVTTWISKEIDKNNEWIDEQYEMAVNRYESDCIKAKNEAEQKNAPLKKQLTMWNQELKQVNELLQNSYYANVIPGQYRNLYAAVYLNDYFTNSGEDDLAMALNTFVLEQIKVKLDIIIEQNSQILLNQHVIISNQRLAMEQQEGYKAMLADKLSKISSSIDEQNRTLQMVECSSKATAYFAEAEYIRNF